MIYFNGKPVAAAKGRTLSELLLLTGRNPSLTAVTVDGVFIPASRYKDFVVPDGAVVEARDFQDGG